MKIKGILIASTTDEYGPIYVYENRTSRILSFDDEIYQGYMKLKHVNRLDLAYTQAMMTGLLFIPKVHTATIMGLGAGSMVKNLLNSYSKLDIHAIECRHAVAQIAKQYFFLPDSDRLFIYIDDAAKYIKNTPIKSDIIFSDLYHSKGMELQQVRSTFLRDCNNALSQHGVLVLNIRLSEPKLRKKLNTLLELEFENRLLSFDVDSGNTIILAFKCDIPSLSREELLSKANCLQKIMGIPIQDYTQLLSDTLSF